MLEELLPNREIIVVYFENRVKRRNKLSEKCANFCMLKRDMVRIVTSGLQMVSMSCYIASDGTVTGHFRILRNAELSGAGVR